MESFALRSCNKFFHVTFKQEFIINNEIREKVMFANKKITFLKQKLEELLYNVYESQKIFIFLYMHCLEAQTHFPCCLYEISLKLFKYVISQ
jgi:hypothetical protein